jgi:hypothetical protein
VPKANNHPLSKKYSQSGTDVMIFKIFSPKKSGTKLAFLTQNKAKLCILKVDRNISF